MKDETRVEYCWANGDLSKALLLASNFTKDKQVICISTDNDDTGWTVIVVYRVTIK